MSDSMVIKELDHFDIAQICNSGQCFRMECCGGSTYRVIAGDRYLELDQKGRECCFYCGEREFEEFWSRYFDLDTDYGSFITSINDRDSYLTYAAQFGGGIRILRQDLWEMTVSFLISQQNNIQRIRRCIENICLQYGEKRETGEGKTYYAFPSPDALAGLDEDTLKECNLGYRSKYVVRAAKSVVSGETDLEKIGKMKYPQAKAELMKLYGVGEKVADCICLFALHQLEAFPVDTHVNQALEKHYRKGFPKRRYKGFQGVIQQYIFYYELLGKNIRYN